MGDLRFERIGGAVDVDTGGVDRSIKDCSASASTNDSSSTLDKPSSLGLKSLSLGVSVFEDAVEEVGFPNHPSGSSTSTLCSFKTRC